MFYNRLLLKFASRSLATSSRRAGGGYEDHGGEYQELPIKTEIGKREIVGYGLSGEASYMDTVAAPFPAIRFKEDNASISRLREKEKGDWKKLTVEEKKELYRASFCQTFAERHAPTGSWKTVLGWTLMGVSVAIWMDIFMQYYVYEDYPWTVTDDIHLKKLGERMITNRVGGIEGFTSTYDYEKNEWKKE